jgi:heat shock protein HslJ
METMKTTRCMLFAGLTCLLLAAACSSPAEDDTVAPTIADPSTPVGTVWRWTSLTGPESLEVSNPGRYTLELSEDRNYAVRADCNTGGGSYTLEGDRLTLGPGPMTMAACPPDSLGDRFVVLLGRVVGFVRDADRLTLHLGDDAGTMELEAMRPVALGGTSWLVRGYNNGKQAVVSVATGTTLHVTFGEDGSVGGSSGCNSFTAGYQVDGRSISLGAAATTRKMCAGEEVMEQEAAFLAALATAATWEIRGERLQLRTAEGSLAVDLVSAVNGTMTYRVRRALPPNAEIMVSLQDISLADAPAKLIAKHVTTSGGKQVPFPFEITFDPADIDPRHTYGLRATIVVDDQLLFTSTEAHPVITRDNPRYGIEITVDLVPR